MKCCHENDRKLYKSVSTEDKHLFIRWMHLLLYQTHSSQQQWLQKINDNPVIHFSTLHVYFTEKYWELQCCHCKPFFYGHWYYELYNVICIGIIDFWKVMISDLRVLWGHWVMSEITCPQLQSHKHNLMRRKWQLKMFSTRSKSWIICNDLYNNNNNIPTPWSRENHLPLQFKHTH